MFRASSDGEGERHVGKVRDMRPCFVDVEAALQGPIGNWSAFDDACLSNDGLPLRPCWSPVDQKGRIRDPEDGDEDGGGVGKDAEACARAAAACNDGLSCPS